MSPSTRRNEAGHPKIFSEKIMSNPVSTDIEPTKKVSWHHGNLREEMLQRGLALLELRGAADLSLREVARLAGVSQTAPTHHFGDKDGLLAAIATEGFHQLMGERLAALKDGMTKERRLRVIMRVYVEFALQHPELFHLMFGPRISDKQKHRELMEVSARSFEFLNNTIAEFMSDHSKDGRPPRFSAIAVWSGMHGLATLLSDRDSGLCQVPDTMIDDVCTGVINLLLGGLKSSHVEAEAPVRRDGRKK
ncbi:TetR/AcrR family transcriptional regulator [Caballeronia eucalypticola]|uniref:TetR/AcrR family transcriptional regulator n=1 Tax=Caballeronia sp. 15715 TaxID=3391030 RepID=UPI0039E53D35